MGTQEFSGDASNDETLAAEGEASGTGDGLELGEAIELGATIGRYLVRERIGVGGMGIVYAAHDPELDRRVALKLLRFTAPTAAHETDASAGHRRLLREAQAMAKLSHANVVTVYDVGTHDGQVFVAMEHIQGSTLSEWLRARPRPWREVLRVFVDAGRGLAAAHAAGLVHRDFKPDNVMIGDDGKVRVMDFGLARTAGGSAPARIDVRTSADELHLTRTGALMGTPAYMAPEQHLGNETDARSDQFSYCVSLWEAVYGERPFKGDSLATLAVAVTEGKISAPPPSVAPARLRRILERGLQRDPQRRFASMDALLVELAGLLARARRRWLAVASVGLIGLAGATLQLGRAGREPSCGDSAAEAIDETWSAPRRRALADTFAGSGLAFAAPTWTRVERVLDTYAGEWSAARAQACESTRQGQQSQLLLDRRMMCLERRRQDLDGLLRVLESGEAGVVEEAAIAVTRLPTLDRCADAEALLAEVAPPEDPAVAAQVEELRATLAAAGAQVAAGRYEPARSLLEPLPARAAELAYEPLISEVGVGWGSALERVGEYAAAEKALDDAYWLASSLKQESLAAEAAIAATMVVGHHLGRLDEVERWQRQAEAAVKRAGDDPLLRAELHETIGTVDVDRGDYESARANHEQALALREEALGPDDPRVGIALQNVGAVLYRQGDYAAAKKIHELALERLRAGLGPDHPKVAKAVMNIGAAHLGLQELDEALARNQEALRLLEASVGSEHREVGDVLNNLCLVQRRMNDLEAARASCERAVAVHEAALGPGNSRVAASLNSLGNVIYAAGDNQGALAVFERALKIRLDALGPDHVDVAYCHQNVANALFSLERFDAAQPHYERAVAIRSASLTPDHPDLALALTNLGNVHAAQGDAAGGLPHLERALEIRRRALPDAHPSTSSTLVVLAGALAELGRGDEAVHAIEEALAMRERFGRPVSELDRAEADFAHARALMARGAAGDRRRATELADAAQATYGAAGEAARASATQLREWRRRVGLG